MAITIPGLPTYDPANQIPDAGVYWIGRLVGLDDEGARAAVAVVITEGGRGGAVNPTDPGGSYGPLQLSWFGQLPNYARYLGVSLQDAAYQAIHDEGGVIAWGLSNYLGNTIAAGQAAGVRGADLATYAQQFGQVSINPWVAGQNYAASVAGADYGSEPPWGLPPPEPPPEPPPVIGIPADALAIIVGLLLALSGGAIYWGVRKAGS